MEFFKITRANATEAKIQESVTVDRLPDFCESIYYLKECTKEEGAMFCLWGNFPVDRQKINGGVRFTLPTCPNALAWTITTGFPPAEDKVILHATINRTDHDPDFLETIETFLTDWAAGIENILGTGAPDEQSARESEADPQAGAAADKKAASKPPDLMSFGKGGGMG